MQRLQTFMRFLELDPENLNLLADTADAAFAAEDFDAVDELLDRYAALAELPKPLINLRGLAALRARRLDQAAAAFDALLVAGVDDPAIRFNRAWVHALNDEYESALALLDDDCLSVTDRAATLRVQMLHHLARIDEALAEGQGLAERFPENDSLLGALSVAALDADDFDLARHYAESAKGGADALTTQGLLALNGSSSVASMALFDRALAENPRAPRALVGKGLAMIMQKDLAGGARALRAGAEIFGDHLGSWIALGWTQLLAHDLIAARATFDHAMSLDDNFAETHGALAVVDIADGKLDSAKRRADTALRLDRGCFGAMLAKILLAEAGGRADIAQGLWEKAINAPVGEGGKTLAEAMVGLGLNPGNIRPGRKGGAKQ